MAAKSAPTRSSTATSNRPSAPTVGLTVSAYDQVSSMLLALLMLLGICVVMMFLMWLSSRITWTIPAAPVSVLEDVGGGGSGNGLPGGEKELEQPNPEEVPELTEAKVEQSLEAISLVVKSEQSALESLGGETSFGNGQGTGSGDGRGPGPGGPGTSDGIPAWERWEVRFSATNIKVYAAQLDFFKVELGVAGGGSPNVEYVSNLSQAKPSVRIGDPKAEKRLRFLYRTGPLRGADRTLVSNAGVNAQGKVVFQFYTPEMYQSLLKLENEKMGKRRIIEVKRTIFGVRGTPSGKFEFFVIDQEYRS